jgi:hypothetical protein
LPIHLFTEYKRFGTFIGAVDIPSPVFLLVFLYFWPRKRMNSNDRGVDDWLIALTLIQFVVWAAGSQQTRFLLSIYPALSISSALVLRSVIRRYQKLRIGYYAIYTLIGSFILLSGYIIGGSVLEIKPFLGLLNLETREQSLTKMLNDYPGLDYINHNLPANSKVMMLWDGRGYYCDHKCLADVDQVGWTALVLNGSEMDLQGSLIRKGITHIFYAFNDRDYFLIGHDSNGYNQVASNIIEKWLVGGKVRLTFEDKDNRIIDLSLLKQ